jgi:hypothetical protein
VRRSRHKAKVGSIEAGLGLGMTAGADTLTFKVMVSRDLNTRRTEPLRLSQPKRRLRRTKGRSASL